MRRVTIDYTSAVRQRAGVGRYTRNLIDALAQVDRDNAYTLFCAGDGPARREWPENFTVRTCPLPERLLTASWHKLKLPLAAEWISGSADIFHSPDFTLPPLAKAAGVVTIHDLSFLKLPECADPGLRAYLTERTPPSVARATRVLADSENTRQDIIELLGAPPDKVSVVYGGVEPRFQPVVDQQRLTEVCQRYRLPESFVLFVGTLEPRKNLNRLIAGYADLRRQQRISQRLVLCGSKGWLYEGIFEQIAHMGLREDVVFPGFVRDEDLPALYTLADLFVFPSLYEGFGLPPLEAMACGTPVVASDNSSLPEVLGQAALYCNAEDVNGLANAMLEGLTDADTRARLITLGLAQARRFTWEEAARQLVKAYEAV